jgi:lysyl-tRNA synthetase class 2
MSDELREARLQKLEEIRGLGIEPYGGKFERKQTAAECHSAYREEKPVVVAGRLTAIREHGKTIFADLTDQSGKIQLYLNPKTASADSLALFKLLALGDIVGAGGKLFQTRKGEITVVVEVITLLSKALRPLPEKWHGLTNIEQRYRQRYLDLISNEESRALFQQRSRIIREIRSFLEEKGFLEVETPMMQSLAGGAAAAPFKTYYAALDSTMYFRIAPELYLKRLLVGGMEKIFELNRNFRNEGLSRRHNPEFTMLEVYQAYGDCRTMMDLVEELVTTVAQKVRGTLRVPRGEGTIDLARPWKRVEYRDLVRRFVRREDWFSLPAGQMAETARGLGLEVTPEMNEVEITNEIYEKSIEGGLVQPTFVTRLPASLVPLAKRCSDDPEVVDVFELEIGGQEIAPGYSELNDPLEQRRRFQAQRDGRDGLKESGIDEDFLAALEYGMPPAGGMGIGIDRLIMVLTGAESVKDVILFPQLRPRT